MPRSSEARTSKTPTLQVAAALRAAFRDGYSRKDLSADLMAGIVVALIAIPLSMSLAISTGVSPQAGLYTVIIAGVLTALLGGSRCQVTGPTAAFVVILLPIVHKFDLGGLVIAGFMAGLILVAMGFARMGRLIEYIPHPVTTGFTSGIALVIFTIQIKDFFGLNFQTQPESYFDRLSFIFTALPNATSGSSKKFFHLAETVYLKIVRCEIPMMCFAFPKKTSLKYMY